MAAEDVHTSRRGAFTPYLDGAVPGLDPVPEPVRANQHVQSRHPGLVSRGPHLFVDDVDHPYETPENLPYHWIRGMQVGGRSLTWGGTSLRLSAYEFDAPALDRRALSWPIRYDDLAPSYAVVEELMGLCGSTENLPRLPDSVYRHSPRSLTPAEAEFQRAYRPGETRAIPVRFIPTEGGRDGWPGFTMQGTALAAAERTRRMVLRPNAVVTGVTVEPGTGRATGVRFIDKTQGTAHEARARVVFLCCGAIETARLLLVSQGPRHPDGLGNSSGWVGRGLMDHPVVAASGVLDERSPVDGYEVSARQRGLLIPAVSGNGVRPFGAWITLQRRVSNGQPCGNIEAQGEMLPYWHNRVCLGDAKDRWGVPIPRIECAYGPHEERLYGAMRQAVEHLAAVARLRIVDVSTALTVPGLNVHDLGTARMGSDPGTSVLDADNRLWDCPNLFVTDGACFPAAGWQNPTLTIMAISVRAARRAAALLREGTY
ncbi:MAG TPA: GMC family oxidoreductase [Pilimelia sp.]|nr:GMC family oxidoreductase [Pilimelia sp.]